MDALVPPTVPRHDRVRQPCARNACRAARCERSTVVQLSVLRPQHRGAFRGDDPHDPRRPLSRPAVSADGWTVRFQPGERLLPMRAVTGLAARSSVDTPPEVVHAVRRKKRLPLRSVQPVPRSTPPEAPEERRLRPRARSRPSRSSPRRSSPPRWRSTRTRAASSGSTGSTPTSTSSRPVRRSTPRSHQAPPPSGLPTSADS